MRGLKRQILSDFPGDSELEEVLYAHEFGADLVELRKTFWRAGIEIEIDALLQRLLQLLHIGLVESKVIKLENKEGMRRIWLLTSLSKN